MLAIMTIIMSIVLTSQSSFNKTLILANTAYDIALSLRSAQSYGLGNRITSSVSNAGYGIHFTTGNSFTLFADTYPAVDQLGLCHPQADSSTPDARPGNCVYEASYGTNQTERTKDYTLNNGITISNFCAYANGWSCVNGGGLSSLDIVFARPNQDAFMSVNGSYSSSLTKACLTITSPQGGFRYVSVASSGAINANATQCP